ncbi:uncharacterized protein MONBRDRAFT_10530 [Monosiga brevicollis MX1]|uniref:Uncharacterized protein n=1 Tax=Monosiga brevicollis TaxID=81824 RepID=A9V6M6_MONBE|nr:uncharacterized protein MONBRDRAFT_10530 [Monosiga brevicollis MX1]EDQ86759.1 predicted protein [Monosiga brevicollis MX1]|eukprot:XP_001748304.1 hypothetical protein [Monosiga brevicollis MX1]
MFEVSVGALSALWVPWVQEQLRQRPQLRYGVATLILGRFTYLLAQERVLDAGFWGVLTLPALTQLRGTLLAPELVRLETATPDSDADVALNICPTPIDELVLGAHCGMLGALLGLRLPYAHWPAWYQGLHAPVVTTLLCIPAVQAVAMTEQTPWAPLALASGLCAHLGLLIGAEAPLSSIFGAIVYSLPLTINGYRALGGGPDQDDDPSAAFVPEVDKEDRYYKLGMAQFTCSTFAWGLYMRQTDAPVLPTARAVRTARYVTASSA